MKRPHLLPLLLLLAAAALPRPVRGEETLPLRRFALVVGANSGSAGRVRLRYAESDARQVGKLLQEMGGVAAEDCALLVEPGRAAFLAAWGKCRDRLAQVRPASRRLEFVFYYSGHSDEEGLQLGRERVGYAELRQALATIPTDARVAVFDSCASGAFIRRKGGSPRQPFLVDVANDLKGSAVMTSSSATEASQESDRIRGSFFTHFLVSGLRGAADASHDGRVTLSEAYQFAFNETLAQTTRSAAGPQHPNYAIEMSGTGDMVMTDIRRSPSRLRLATELTGRLYLQN